MELDEYRKMFAYEDGHWWFRGKRTIIAALLARWAPRHRPLSILDVGCGTGANLRLLGRFGEGVGVDLEPLALTCCRRRGLDALVRANAAEMPFRDDHFDVVTLLDVLYHRRVADVARALGEARRVCRAGGLLVVTDSAFPALRSRHDAAVHGARRFRRQELAAAVAQSGFAVLKTSYMNTLLFPVAAAVRLADRLRGDAEGRSSVALPGGVMNRVLVSIYGLEAWLLPRIDLPFGLSVLVIGRKLTADERPARAPLG